MTPSQLIALKADIAANTNQINGVAINAMPLNDDANFAIAGWYNGDASPVYWVWKTSIFESEITRQPSADATNWSWPAYIARSIQEQNAWARLFMGGQSGMNPSLTNVRQGLADIFSGSANSAPAQRSHLLAICRRNVKRIERLFVVAATGPGNDGIANNRGSTTNPDALGFEGTVSYQDISQARNLP